MDDLSTQQFVQQTGVAEGTLRMWERRHGFPAPRRLPGGHRRYSQADAELVRRVARDRAAGLTLTAAISRATEVVSAGSSSVFATIRRRRPDLEPRTLSKPMLLTLTHAIEDEVLARAERSLAFASFQSQRFYRQSERRWRQLSRTADMAVVFADFDRPRTPRGAPVEIPIAPDGPIAREWTLVFWSPGQTVCLSAWEPPARGHQIRSTTVFEAVWSVEPDVVHQAATVCADIAAASISKLEASFRAHLEADPGPPAVNQLRLAAAITNRMLSYLS